MADGQDKNRCFGQEEGLGKRLAMWANSLGRNKMYPWLGLGIVDDLKCAAKILGVDFDSLYPTDIYTHRPEVSKAITPVIEPPLRTPVPPKIDTSAWDDPAPATEYDL